MRIITLLTLLIVLNGCSHPRLPSARELPFVYKIDVQQGNVLTQEMLAQLSVGMDKKKVHYVMGTPIIKDTFNDHRWDYIYTYEYGGGHTERRHIVLEFDDDKLVSVSGDVKPAETPLIMALHQDTAVKVPGLKKRGLLTRIKQKIPFVPEEREVAEEILPGDEDKEKEGEEEEEEEDLLVYEFEEVEPVSPYVNIQEAPGEGIIVPPDAPRLTKKKGFLARLFDGIGLGAGEDEDEDDRDDEEYDPGDKRYRDITNPDSAETPGS